MHIYTKTNDSTTLAIWSIIWQHTECVKGICENVFFIPDQLQNIFFGKPKSVWVLSEYNQKPSEALYVDKQNVSEVCECCLKNTPNNKKTHLN